MMKTQYYKKEKRKQKKHVRKLYSLGVVFFLVVCFGFGPSSSSEFVFVKNNLLSGQAAFAAHTSKENNAGLSVSDVVVQGVSESQVSTKIYPGYTMSFDVAVVSGFAENQKIVMFEYSVVDADDTVIYSIGEQRKMGKEDVFTKKMTLPLDIKPGKYKLRIKSVVDKQIMVQEQFIEIEKSPVVTLKENGRFFLINLVTNSGWFLGGVVVFSLTAAFLVGILIVHRRSQVRSH